MEVAGRGDPFQGGCSFYIKNKLKSEIFNDKKKFVNKNVFLMMMMMMMNCFIVWLIEERRLALFPAGSIVRDPHHSKSPARHEVGLNLRRT